MKISIRSIWLFLALLLASGGALAQQCPAQSINFGETKNGALTTSDCVATYPGGGQYYVDVYQFTGTAGQQIAISNSSTVIDPDLTLWFPDSTTFVYDDDSGGGLNARIPASGFLTLTQTGTYEIWASSALQLQTGPYTLTLTQAGAVQFTVTGAASPSAGGSVSCTSPVNSGSSTTCAITTNQGYTLTGASSSSCGGSLSGSTYTTGAVTSACTVTATFTPIISTPTCTLTASPSTITAGQSSTLTATCNPAASSYAWTNTGFAATASSGTVTPTVTTTYTVVGSNAAGSGNTASATVTVTCSYSILPASKQVADTASSGMLNVTTGSGCAWNAVSNVAWIVITSGASGSGNGAVAYSVAANTDGSSRTGTLSVAGQTFTVTQSGVTSAPLCTLTASPSTITAGQSSTLTATCNPAPTSYAWTNTGFAATASSGSVSPTEETTYSVIGSNAAGSGNGDSVTVTVSPAPSYACLLDWAELTYPTLFSPRSQSQTFGPYTYRYYSQTNSFLGTSSTNNHVYYVGILSGNTLLDLGDASIWNATAGCAGGVPVTGGTFSDPSGASVAVTTGTIPPDVNAKHPTMKPSPSVPSGMTIDVSQGDVNVTAGAPGYDFNLTGDSGFATTSAGAVILTLPFNALAVPSADQGDPAKTFVRLFSPDDNSQVDLTGDISITGSSGMLTVEMRGLPLQLTAAVIYNPNMDSVASEEATVPAVEQRASQLAPSVAVTATSWPAQQWCVHWNSANPNLIASVKNILGLAGNPTREQIRTVVANLVAGSAKKSQTIYQTDGLNAPNLSIVRTCSDRRPRYNVYLIDGGSKFQPDDPGEPVSSGAAHYGRLYVGNGRLDDGINTVLGTVLGSISHEMLHAIQASDNLQQGQTTRGYSEGSAATYGKSIDNNQVIKVRDEMFFLNQSLMSPAVVERYDNEDFFAYVGKQYNGGSLNYISGLYARMHATIGAGVINPSAATMYGAMDTYFNAAFSQSLQNIYLDFVKQRALTHNAASQFGRAGEVVAGFAENVFNGGLLKQNVDVGACKGRKVREATWSAIKSFATRAIVVSPTGVVPAGETNPTLVVKIKPTSSAINALWKGVTGRAGVTTALTETNKFPNFGKQAGDQVVILVSHLDPANAAGAFELEISCDGVIIDSISPVKGPVDTSVTITGSGFGTAADTRSVTFNGVTATNVTFNSDTQAVAKVPQNASTGDVIVTVNGEKSNGVNFEVIAQCSATQNAGGDTPDFRTVELGKPAGTFIFNYETFTQKDQIIVRYQGNTLFDTGCVGANGSRSLSYGGTSTQITVQVIPNCAGGSGTAWNYSVSCP